MDERLFFLVKNFFNLIDIAWLSSRQHLRGAQPATEIKDGPISIAISFLLHLDLKMFNLRHDCNAPIASIIPTGDSNWPPGYFLSGSPQRVHQLAHMPPFPPVLHQGASSCRPGQGPAGARQLSGEWPAGIYGSARPEIQQAKCFKCSCLLVDVDERSFLYASSALKDNW